MEVSNQQHDWTRYTCGIFKTIHRMLPRYYIYAFVTTRGFEEVENLGISFDRGRRRNIYHCFLWALKILWNIWNNLYLCQGIGNMSLQQFNIKFLKGKGGETV